MSTVRLYVLLLVCLAMASAVVHKIQTQHHALSGKHSKHLFGHASLRHQQLYRRKVGMQASVGKLPLEEVDYWITGVITVGTPPQSFNVEVDAFFNNELVLLAPNASVKEYAKENLPEKKTYNAGNSSTYVAVNGNVSTWDIKAHKAQDVLNIGSLSATIKSFVVTDVLRGGWSVNYFPVDGVLADDLVDQLDKPLISVYLNATRGGNGTGQVTLGAEDTDNCQSTWSYVPAAIYYAYFTQFSFSVHASSAEVTIGGQLTTVNLDSNVTLLPYPGIAVPISTKDLFVNGTGTIYNESIGVYTIDCDTTKSPLIKLNIGGVENSTDNTSQKLVLSGADYIRYWKSQDVCYLDVHFYSGSIDNLGTTTQWFFGSEVLNNHCISFNYKERTVGFADSKTPKTDNTYEI
ncbi:eukaryotic aspartyl protease domain-containing protein [Ditylenchus destructor]|nr:eukaryotic aspartyl protease domain-containing protein [Ditylenchus destructor]